MTFLNDLQAQPESLTQGSWLLKVLGDQIAEPVRAAVPSRGYLFCCGKRGFLYVFL